MVGRLRVVTTEEFDDAPISLLVTSTTGLRQRIEVEEAAVQLPIISMELNRFYTLTDWVDAGALGKKMGALLPYIWRGERRFLEGAVMQPLGRALLTVPFGFLNTRLS